MLLVVLISTMLIGSRFFAMNLIQCVFKVRGSIRSAIVTALITDLWWKLRMIPFKRSVSSSTIGIRSRRLTGTAVEIIVVTPLHRLLYRGSKPRQTIPTTPIPSLLPRRFPPLPRLGRQPGGGPSLPLPLQRSLLRLLEPLVLRHRRCLFRGAPRTLTLAKTSTAVDAGIDAKGRGKSAGTAVATGHFAGRLGISTCLGGIAGGGGGGVVHGGEGGVEVADEVGGGREAMGGGGVGGFGGRG
mmetsp:Transcript_20244/g.42459  ORF Transcript_20244/g.42459 Transcript_20244/m.42459 type:complete len:242 (-) Transcript_20244:74-799(-)